MGVGVGSAVVVAVVSGDVVMSSEQAASAVKTTVARESIKNITAMRFISGTPYFMYNIYIYIIYFLKTNSIIKHRDCQSSFG